ncbi:STAS domain-containing protein [Streptomyces sp. NPDC051954]|uniref:STAS domain-containing protein n=1 Tax=unclassified Streptomyces TaxID=2593676 RepID=UPI00343D7FE7
MHGNVAPPSQHVRAYETAGRTVVELLGEIDISVAVRVNSELDAATERPGTGFVIDLGPVEFLDCYGLRILCRARRRVEERGGHLTVVCPHRIIRKMIRIVGLGPAFALTTTLAEALDGRTAEN